MSLWCWTSRSTIAVYAYVLKRVNKVNNPICILFKKPLLTANLSFVENTWEKVQTEEKLFAKLKSSGKKGRT
jgi:hypothetical protein